MKKPETIFDKHKQEEDISLSTLDDNKTEEEKIKMLLLRYNTEIFEPNINELDTVSPRELDFLMRKTVKSRPIQPRRIILKWQTFAYAASLFIVCGLAFVTLHTNNGKHGLQKGLASEFRGISDSGQTPAVIAAPPEKQQAPLAYLVDIQGKVMVSRGQQTPFPPSSCEVLYQNDVVMLQEKAKAKIMYEDAIFNIAGPRQYVISNPNPALAENGKTTNQQLQPTITTRGMHLGLNNVQAMVMPPKTLLASVVTPITRTGKTIDVYSPRGASFTNTPVIMIGGDPDLIYVVSILDLENTVVGRSVEVKGKSLHQWHEFTSAPIVEDEIYTLRITHNGKIVNDINNSSFWLLSKNESEKVRVAMKHLSTLNSKSEKLFFQANALYINGCYSEALLMIEQINDSRTPLCDKLQHLCKTTLGIKE